MDRKLVFYGILDFFPRRDEIKATYDTLSLRKKKEYKMYVYSICFEREYVKDLIWEFLNEWEESYMKLIDEYMIKRRKQRDVYIKNNINSNNNNSVDISN